SGGTRCRRATPASATSRRTRPSRGWSRYPAAYRARVCSQVTTCSGTATAGLHSIGTGSPPRRSLGEPIGRETAISKVTDGRAWHCRFGRLCEARLTEALPFFTARGGRRARERVTILPAGIYAPVIWLTLRGIPAE